MNTQREDNHGEYWADEGIYLRFNMKKVWAWLVSLFLLSGVCQAQVAYCGVDVASDLVPYGGVAKQTLSNGCTYSEQADHANWTKTNMTVSANSAVAPDGTTTADTLTNTAINATHSNYSTGITVVAGSVYRQSIYIKYLNHAYFQLRSQSPGTALVNILLSSSSASIASIGASTLSASVRTVGNGWYKVEFTYTKGAGVTDYVTYHLTNSSYATSWASNGTEAMYIWGASLQLASDPSDYLQAVASATTLGPLCPVGYTQSLTDPSRCFIVGPVTSRTIRTW
jgi:hypothetical protein